MLSIYDPTFTSLLVLVASTYSTPVFVPLDPRVILVLVALGMYHIIRPNKDVDARRT